MPHVDMTHEGIGFCHHAQCADDHDPDGDAEQPQAGQVAAVVVLRGWSGQVESPAPYGWVALESLKIVRLNNAGLA